MIPKVIHYCWFGGNEKTELIRECIKSWKKYMPDYEIIEWNETNFDINSNLYVAQAYKAKKWAFVSDYARLYAIYN
ncbi:MAG: glycosyl transferase, partial [Lachnospiraceae bacterium]|nr:glycosyl transferase [Lachnospiraceae bacterium]